MFSYDQQFSYKQVLGKCSYSTQKIQCKEKLFISYAIDKWTQTSRGQNKNNVIKESHINVQFQINWQDGSLHERAPELDQTQEQLDSVENHRFTTFR